MIRTAYLRLGNSNASVYICPLQLQTSCNYLKKQLIENAVVFFQDLVPHQICEVLMKILLLSRITSLNHRMADLKIAELIKPYQENWEKEFQQFLNAPRERKQEILSNQEARGRITKLKSFLEKRHLRELRNKFPSIPQENLQTVLKQEANFKKCIKIIQDREDLKKKAISNMPNNKEDNNFKGCFICCDEKDLIIFPTCGHEFCCKECASKLLKCPLCRVPISH
jgi:hypothetical protein